METQTKKLREQISLEELKANFNECVRVMNEMAEKNDYTFTNTATLFSEGPDFSKLTTKSGRKKLAKRIHYFLNRPSIKNANSLFRFLKHRGMVMLNMSMKVGEKERNIIHLRATYRQLAKEAKKALEAYKIEKGDFYKKRVVN